jgi:hypothetical protein
MAPGTFSFRWTTLPVFKVLGFSISGTLALLLPAMLAHALVWNMLHPPMHGLPPVPASVGAPSAWPFGLHDQLRDSFYFKYIYENHQGASPLDCAFDPSPKAAPTGTN